jgi:preprotein translocase subunit YajC
MTKKEIKAKTEEKMKKIQALIKELQVTVSAEEVVTESGIIRKVVYYLDNEKYPVDKNEENSSTL